jgi:hypothetical protein
LGISSCRTPTIALRLRRPGESPGFRFFRDCGRAVRRFRRAKVACRGCE